MRTEAEMELGADFETRRRNLEDSSKFDWNEDRKCYVSKDKRHCFDTDGQELLQGEHDLTFKDVAKLMEHDDPNRVNPYRVWG